MSTIKENDMNYMAYLCGMLSFMMPTDSVLIKQNELTSINSIQYEYTANFA